jgi:hypothetical protein
MVTAWKCAKTFSEFWWQKNWLLHHDNASSHTSFLARNVWPKTKWLSSPAHPTSLCFPSWR